MGSGCGSVGRVVASKTNCLRIESSHWQILNSVLKRERKKKKETGNGICKLAMSVYDWPPLGRKREN